LAEQILQKKINYHHKYTGRIVLGNLFYFSLNSYPNQYPHRHHRRGNNRHRHGHLRDHYRNTNPYPHLHQHQYNRVHNRYPHQDYYYDHYSNIDHRHHYLRVIIEIFKKNILNYQKKIARIKFGNIMEMDGGGGEWVRNVIVISKLITGTILTLIIILIASVFTVAITTIRTIIVITICE